MKPSLYFKPLGLTLLLSLFFASCEKDSLSNEKENVKTAKNLAYITPNGKTEQLRPSTFSDELNDCDCWFEIIEDDVHPGFGTSEGDYEYYLTSSDQCDGTECFNMSAVRTTEDECLTYTASDAVFGDTPTNFFPFNCVVEGGSTIVVEWMPNWFHPTCSPASVTSSSYVKFRLRCVDRAPLNCGLGSGYYSDEIIITRGTGLAPPPAYIRLGGCGCEPGGH